MMIKTRAASPIVTLSRLEPRLFTGSSTKEVAAAAGETRGNVSIISYVLAGHFPTTFEKCAVGA